MNRWKKFCVLSVALCAWAAVAIGQMGLQMGPRMGMMRPPSVQGVFNPVIGSGAAYEMTDKNQRKSTMEISIVGKESVNIIDAKDHITGKPISMEKMMQQKMQQP